MSKEIISSQSGSQGQASGICLHPDKDAQVSLGQGPVWKWTTEHGL